MHIEMLEMHLGASHLRRQAFTLLILHFTYPMINIRLFYDISLYTLKNIGPIFLNYEQVSLNLPLFVDFKEIPLKVEKFSLRQNYEKLL